MKDKKVEDEKKGTPNYEHLDEDLHVLIMVEDTEERARLKLQKSVEEVNFLLTPPVSWFLGSNSIKYLGLCNEILWNANMKVEI